MGYVQHVQLWHGTSTSDRDGPFFVFFLVWCYFVATAIQQSEDRSIKAITLILELCEAASSRHLKAYLMGAAQVLTHH